MMSWTAIPVVLFVFEITVSVLTESFHSPYAIIHINDLSDVINLKHGICVDGPIIYSCLNKKPDGFNEIKLAADVVTDFKPRGQ